MSISIDFGAIRFLKCISQPEVAKKFNLNLNLNLKLYR